MAIKNTPTFSELATEVKSGKLRKPGKKTLLIIVSLLIFVVVLAVGGYFYMDYQEKGQSVNGKLSDRQIKELLKEVGERMELPEGETPTIATVTDVSKLEDQPFFKKAQNGDKVIIYGSTQKAILYRPSTHKIIDVAQINVNTETQDAAQATTAPLVAVSTTPAVSPSVSPSPAEEAVKLKVVVLNSTKEAGLAKKGAALLDKEKAEVTKTSNAVGEYEKTTVSSVAKGKKIPDKDLKSLVSGFTKMSPTVAALPSDEQAPTGADVVIILGTDFSEAY